MAAASRVAWVELRGKPRAALEQPIEFSVNGSDAATRYAGVARDISLGGMFIETYVVGSPRDLIVVHLTLPGSTRRMALLAIVRWITDEGMGVQFGLLGARETHEIAEFVARSQT
jgi:type IV pilus assembly protein PilZ